MHSETPNRPDNSFDPRPAADHLRNHLNDPAPVDDNLAKTERLAEIAFNAYGDAAGWKNFLGQDIPRWHAVNPSIKSYWVAATRAVMGAL